MATLDLILTSAICGGLAAGDPQVLARTVTTTTRSTLDDPLLDDALDEPAADGAATAPAAAADAGKPEFNGRGLLIGAYAATGFSWASRIIATGIIGASSCTDADSCIRQVQTAAAFTYLAPISQFVATGLVIPGAFLKGRADAWSFGRTGSPDRKGRNFVIAGAVLFGVFTATSIAIRPAYILGCGSVGLTGGCASRGAAVGYFLGAQVSDTLSTVGAGLMTYGLSYARRRKRDGRAASMSFGPWTAGRSYGLSLSGRL